MVRLNLPMTVKKYLAKWEHIQQLQQLEEHSLIKMFKLIHVSAKTKPLEMQRVETGLCVVCDEICTALKNHPEMQHVNIDGTVTLKIVNVKSPFENVRL